MNSPVVVTGMGLVSPLGCGTTAVWNRLVEGESGIGSIDRFNVNDFPVKIAGLVPTAEQHPLGLDVGKVVDAKERKKIDLFTLYALAAAHEALAQAGWAPSNLTQQSATATIIASGIGGFPVITAAQDTLRDRGYKRVSPFTVPAFLANLAAGHVSIRYGFKGPLGCPVTACAAGIQAIGDGIRMLKTGEAEVVLAGGAEACVDPLSLAGFHALKALSTDNDAPARASRPFDHSRNGFVMGEGAGLLVMETLAHAQARGARPLAVLSGYGTSADAHHITSGPEDGSGAAQAIQSALKMAGLGSEQIEYINAHATSTPVGDRAELAALRKVFGDALSDTPISSTKSSTGHLLGAAGGVAAIFACMSTLRGQLPPTLNMTSPDADMEDLDFVPGWGRNQGVRHALVNGFGFGGVNASLVVSRAE